jgi:membrane associated rhomboid family serine protease
MHLAGNMLFLWVFGDNVEDAMGSIKYGLFYLVAGLAAAAAQVAMGADSLVPMVGASGAIGGVLGAYLILFPRARVQTLITLGVFFTTTELPAIVVLGLWFVMQLVSGLGVLGMHQAGGVAFAAHVGGFVCGLLLGRLLGSAPNEPDWNGRAPYPGNDHW